LTNEKWDHEKHAMILIVGAGPCGLAAARTLEQHGMHDWLLVEKTGTSGGLAGSVYVDGWTFDNGGHVSFPSPGNDEFYPLIRSLFGEEELHEQDRSSYVWLKDRWVPYPLQGNCHLLPEPWRTEAITDVLDAPGCTNGQATFEQWCLDTLGKTLTEIFMRPYNLRVWTVPISHLSTTWLGGRVQGMNKSEFMERVQSGEPDIRWGPNNRFLFPREGGTGAIWQRLARTLPSSKLLYDRELVSLDLAHRQARLSDGSVVAYDHVINSMPLNQLVSRTNASRKAKKAARTLESNSTLIVGVGYRGPVESEASWLYFPEDHQPFYRATNFTRYAEANSPPNAHTWMCEIGVRSDDRHLVDEKQQIKETIAGLSQAGLADPVDVIFTHHHWIDQAYPIPTLERDAALRTIQPELESMNVLSRGRFGSWRYELGNQDHAVAAGIDAVRRILDGAKERNEFY
jgi:protoporphyrinogen oxidase